jgi:GAF domain-containing protein
VQGQVIRANGDASAVVGVIWDVTARKQQDLDRQFLLDLSGRFTELSDAAELIELAVLELSRYLSGLRCTYGEVDVNARKLRILADSGADGPSAVGTYPLDGWSAVVQQLEAGVCVAVKDAETDPRTADAYRSGYEPLGTKAFLSVPLHRGGVWRAYLAVSDRRSRDWSERERELLQGVAERLWPVLENSRLLQLTR